MASRRRSGLHTSALLLAALSVAMVLGVSVTAAVVQAGDNGGGGGSGTLVRRGGEGTHDYSGWRTVKGDPGPSATPAGYRVPSEWTAQSADDPVQYKDSDGAVLANGHATSYYYGNQCKQAKAPIAGGWAAFSDTDDTETAGDDLVEFAEHELKGWGRGYATNRQGTNGTMTAYPGESVTLEDGTPAGRARMEIDMTVFDGDCLPDTAEIMVTSIDTPDGVKSLVQARYLLAQGGVTDEVWDGIADSLAPEADK